MDKYYIKFKEDIPKYIQIINHIKKLIYHREILDGEKLPAIRTLSKKLGVNNVTIVNAYNKLEIEGYAISKIGSGTFAKERERSEEHTSELQSRQYLVCRLLLE